VTVERIRILALGLLAATACGGEPVPEVSDEGSSGGDDTEALDPCADACTETTAGAGLALCQACRCKAAFDDWLPAVEQLQCEHGEPIITYTAALSEDGFELEPSPPSSLDCANPSLLTNSCRQGSRLGHLVHDDIEFYWICRDPLLELDGTVLYEDMAVIGHNRRTGATCFWDDVDGHTHDADTPAFDLEAATEPERERFAERFTYADGSGCVTCHDHDPFVYTPYLRSTTWESIAAERGPYHVVGLAGEARPTGVRHLVSPEAAACTTCHRLGSENTCTQFAPDSMGVRKGRAYEDAVRDAMGPSSPHWQLAHWMPATGADMDRSSWQSQFAAAREHILTCCEAPGVDTGDCQWAPVPAD
jgi:hypothetical protein